MSQDIYPDLSKLPKRPFLVTLGEARLSVLIVFFISREEEEDDTMDPCFDEEATTAESARIQIELLLAEEEITQEDATRLNNLLDEIRLPATAPSPLALGPLTVHFVHFMGGELNDFLDEVVDDEDDRASLVDDTPIAEIALHLWRDVRPGEDTIVIHDEVTGQRAPDHGAQSALWSDNMEAAVG